MTARTTRNAAILCAVLAIPLPALAGRSARALGGASYVPDEVLVKFRAGATARERRATVAAHGHAIIGDLLRPGWSRIAIAPGEAVEAIAAAYRADRAVETAQPNYVYRLDAVPNDPAFGQLWGLRNTGQIVTSQLQGGASFYTTHNPGTAGADIDVVNAWNHVTDCSAAVVAIVDSGVNYQQQDLAANMWNGGTTYPNHGWDFVDGDDDPMDGNGHGTHVAGVVGAAGNDGSGTSGVCWSASLMAVRVMDEVGEGTTADVVSGIDFAVAHGAAVVNLSLGGDTYDSALAGAIADAQGAGVVVVVSAGNSGTNNDLTPSYPCSFANANLVCVAALDQAYELATFSNYGAGTVDVGAPGTNILSTWAGTSTRTTDPLAYGWTRTSTTYTGWGYVNDTVRNYLADPASYPNSYYARNTDDRAWKSFYVPAVDVAVLRFAAAMDLVNGDYFVVAYSTAGNDPFAAAGTVLGWATGIATFPYLLPESGDLSACLGATCSIGFQLQSANRLQTDMGVAVANVAIDTLALGPSGYDTLNGTSMAAPFVTGVAAMLRAYNPQYTAEDVVTAISGGGRAVAALAGKTTSGKAIDATRALAFLHAPQGLAATVH